MSNYIVWKCDTCKVRPCTCEPGTKEVLVVCSFCDKDQSKVDSMVAAEKANICDDCVDLARDVIGWHRIDKRETK